MKQVADTVRKIWEDCTTDLHLTPMRNSPGHMANLRSVLELEYHYYLTGPPTRALHVYNPLWAVPGQPPWPWLRVLRPR